MYTALFFLFIVVIVAQRLLELRLAKRNEARARARGAKEYGAGHYPFIVGLHALWVAGMLLEAHFGSRLFPPFAPLAFALWLLLQGVRYWIIVSLGEHWNTRVLVVLGDKLVKRGLYKVLKHPNYLLVALELLLAPLTFGLYFTAALASLANAALMMVRIPTENRALKELER